MKLLIVLMLNYTIIQKELVETEYKFVFKGTGDTEEEDLFDEADFILVMKMKKAMELLGEDMKLRI